MKELDVREYLDFEDLIKLQLLVSCKINRLENELSRIIDLPFVLNEQYTSIRSKLNYYENLYADIEAILLNY